MMYDTLTDRNATFPDAISDYRNLVPGNTYYHARFQFGKVAITALTFDEFTIVPASGAVKAKFTNSDGRTVVKYATDAGMAAYNHDGTGWNNINMMFETPVAPVMSTNVPMFTSYRGSLSDLYPDVFDLDRLVPHDKVMKSAQDIIDAKWTKTAAQEITEAASDSLKSLIRDLIDSNGDQAQDMMRDLGYSEEEIAKQVADLKEAVDYEEPEVDLSTSGIGDLIARIFIDGGLNGYLEDTGEGGFGNFADAVSNALDKQNPATDADDFTDSYAEAMNRLDGFDIAEPRTTAFVSPEDVMEGGMPDADFTIIMVPVTFEEAFGDSDD